MRAPNTVDFWRGFALIEIVVNHIPDNGFWRFTHRQISWSDSAELFVFLAGWSLARRLRGRQESWRDLMTFCGARFGKIYLGHVATTMIVVAMYLFFSHLLRDPDLLSVNHAELATASPESFLGGVLLLTEQVRYIDILPLYAVLALGMPVLFALRNKPAGYLIAISAGLYCLSLFLRLDLPTWPDQGRWFFDPLAWQAPFVAGFLFGRERDMTDRIARSAPYLFPLAALFVVLAMVLMVGGWAPGGEGAMNGLPYYFFDKGSLGILRLVQFLALAFVVARLTFLIPRFIPRAWLLLSFLGRNALAVFCAGCVVSAAGQIAHRAGLHGAAFDSLFMLCALALLCAVAKTRELARGTHRARRARPALGAIAEGQPLPAMR